MPSAGVLEAGRAVIKFVLNDKDVAKGLQAIQRKAAQVGQSLMRIGSLGAAAAASIGAPLIVAVKAASDARETMSKFGVVFAEQTAVVKEWSDNFAKSVGRSKYEVAGFLASFQDLLVPMGMAAGPAAEMSKQLSALAVDLGSFNNMADADVVRDLQAALTGSGEVMKKYGVIVSEAAVKQELLNMGLDPKAVSEAEKAQARLNIIMAGTTAAQGDATGKRRTLRLGVAPRKQAERFLIHVENLISAQILGSTPADETTRWLATVSDKMRERIAKVGLIRGEVEKTIGLGAFLEGYEQTRGDVKESTATFYGHTIRNLKAFFGAGKPLGDVTVADASKFRQWLVSNEGLTDSTIRRRCSLARQFFAFAVDDRIIAENPFGKLKGIGVISNRDRDYFLTREDAAKVLAACPDAEWRAVFALARYGGLRTPSETLALRWADVDWAAGKVRVTSPKTEHHVGKGSRVIPLFPELREHLEDLFDPENEFVITRLRALGKNMRTQLERIVKRAGLTPWPKLFQNLRSTRETELAEAFPIHVVCEWIGNSRAVAQKHYLQVTDDHFADAAGREKKAAQKTAQQAAARRCKAMNTAPDSAPFSHGTSRNPANPERNGQREWAAQDSNL